MSIGTQSKLDFRTSYLPSTPIIGMKFCEKSQVFENSPAYFEIQFLIKFAGEFCIFAKIRQRIFIVSMIFPKDMNDIFNFCVWHVLCCSQEFLMFKSYYWCIACKHVRFRKCIQRIGRVKSHSIHTVSFNVCHEYYDLTWTNHNNSNDETKIVCKRRG